MAGFQTVQDPALDDGSRRELAKVLKSLVTRLESMSLTSGPARPDAKTNETPAVETRELLAGGTPDVLSKLTEAIQNLARRTAATATRSANAGAAPATIAGSVEAAVATLKKDASRGSDYMLLDEEQILGWFGKPTGISPHGQTVRWTYRLPGKSHWLRFTFHEGRVIGATDCHY